MAFFAGLYGVATFMDKASTVPYVRCLSLIRVHGLPTDIKMQRAVASSALHSKELH